MHSITDIEYGLYVHIASYVATSYTLSIISSAKFDEGYMFNMESGNL